MFQTAIFKESHIEPLADGIMKVLAQVGIRCENQQILKAAEENGAVVDYSLGQIRFPRKMVETFIENVSKETAQRIEANGFEAPAPPTLSIQVAPFIYDYKHKEKRPGNKQDFIELAKLGNSLHGDQGVGHFLYLQDVHPLVEPLEAALLLAEYVDNPRPCFAWDARQIDYLDEMGAILGKGNLTAYGSMCFVHPQRFDMGVADKFVRLVRSGSPTGLTSMAVAGVTAPVTLEGYVIVAAAEFIAMWLCARALNSAVPLTGDIWPGTMDMASGAISYATPDSMIYGFAVAELIRRWCTIDITVSAGQYTDSTLPGLAALYETANKAMLIASFTGRYTAFGDGMLGSGSTICAAQLLLEREYTQALKHLDRRIEPTDENLALETILQIGLSNGSSYLETEHTLRHYRESTWQPKLLDRLGWVGHEHEDELLGRLQNRVEELIAQYKKPEVDPDTLHRMSEVSERAKNDLMR